MELAERSSVILALSWILFIQRKRKLARLGRGWDTPLPIYLWKQCTQVRQQPFVLISVPLFIEGYLPFSHAFLPWLHENFAAYSHGTCMRKEPGQKNWKLYWNTILKIDISTATAVVEHMAIIKGLDSSGKVWKSSTMVSIASTAILGSCLLPAALQNCQSIYLIWC